MRTPPERTLEEDHLGLRVRLRALGEGPACRALGQRWLAKEGRMWVWMLGALGLFFAAGTWNVHRRTGMVCASVGAGLAMWATALSLNA